MMHTSPPAKLPGLMAKLVENSLEETEIDLLRSLLSGSAEARRYYYCYLDLHEELGQRVAFAPLAKSISPAKSARVTVTTIPTWRTRAISFAAIAAVFYGVFVAVAWNLRPDKLPSRSAGGGDPVAVVRDTTNVQWSKNSASKIAESTILQDEPLQMDSGQVTLNLKRGVKLIIDGPAEWSIDGDNQATLRSGKLAAQVPPQAVGFTVQTPTSRIVDLGTEFDVEVSLSGTTEVQVIKGKVELYSDAKRGTDLSATAASQPISLSAGSAVRVEPARAGGVPVVHKIVATPNRLEGPSGPAKSHPIRVHGTLASSEFPTWESKHLIDGSGMHGDRHDNVPGTMWMTRYGRVKNEFVLFDLGRPYQLESMKVWNINDSRDRLHISRGVKQANVYVSTSNKGNPLTDPDDWSLVAENHEFTVAPGTADYATPDVVLLGGVVARFAAIVILDHLGPDPRGNPPSDFSVGLSEVQFFGSRKEPEARR
jgi:hypothetical protein